MSTLSIDSSTEDKVGDVSWAARYEIWGVFLIKSNLIESWWWGCASAPINSLRGPRQIRSPALRLLVGFRLGFLHHLLRSFSSSINCIRQKLLSVIHPVPNILVRTLFDFLLCNDVSPCKTPQCMYDDFHKTITSDFHDAIIKEFKLNSLTSLYLFSFFHHVCKIYVPS